MWPLEILLLLVAQLCPTFMLPMDCGPSGSSVRGISQSRILEWVAISFSRGSSRPRDRILVSCTAGGFFPTESIGKSFLDYSRKNIIIDLFIIMNT